MAGGGSGRKAIQAKAGQTERRESVRTTSEVKLIGAVRDGGLQNGSREG